MERSVAYLAGRMQQFLRKGDPVLICFSADKENDLGSIFARAAEQCGAHPTIWGPDLRWGALLRQAFFCRAGTIIAPPLVVLGLTKLARAKGTPLYIRNVVTAGYPCADWMIDGILNGLDCKTWGCFDCDHGSLVAGFSCRAGRGVHLWEEEYEPVVTDDAGYILPKGQQGQLSLRHRPTGVVIDTGDAARIDSRPCSCGSDAPRLMDLAPGPQIDLELIALGEEINQWTSVLDCLVQKGENGLEIEIVVFPGERLPRLPSCAKLIVRPWDAEKDVPFWTVERWKNIVVSTKKH